LAELLSVQEAQKKILDVFHPLPSETVGLSEAGGRILFAPITSSFEFPPFSNSSMDGFAVRTSDIGSASAENPVILNVVSDIPAGSQPSICIEAGQSARVMTGAPIPEGADAVIPVENTDATHSGHHSLSVPEKVKIFQSAQPGDYIRFKGTDLKAGETVLKPGKVLQPQDIGLLASMGIACVQVYRRPKIALFSNGNELLEAGQPLQAGKIYDSNSYMLLAWLKKIGAQVEYLGIARDQLEDVQSILDNAVAGAPDLIISSAGVSVGVYDFVRIAVEKQGKLNFWRANIRPGKPIAFGEYCGIPFMGLPGNPVSSFVGFMVFALPAIRKMSGSQQIFAKTIRVITGEEIESDGRESYLRVNLKEDDGKIIATQAGHQGSGNIFSLLAKALLIVPSGVKSLPFGTECNALLLDENELK